jgi:glycosyltransferase involved in cell wall biosynthesis
VGFAFNRLVRMRYYEKIFSEEVEIFLFTTDKYKGKEKKNYQFQWDLKRTKIHVEEYNPFTLSFKLRKFCEENKIERILNLGDFTSCLLLFHATIFSKRDFVMNQLADISCLKMDSPKDIFITGVRFLMFLFLLLASNKTIIVDYAEHKTYKNLAKFLFISPRKIKYLPAPVNTKLFRPLNKMNARKKIKLPLRRNIVIFVGRVGYEKGSDILKELIEVNPDIFFILIGRLLDKEYINTKTKNFMYLEKKSPEELVDYYNAADLCYDLHRLKHGGLGLAVEEALATGISALSPIRPGIKKTSALIQITVNFEKANQSMRDFFKLSSEERKRISKEARAYAEKYYSGEANKDRYVEYYLN